MRDPYEVLGLAKGADIKDIKKAYRKLARDLHPDLHPGDTKAEDRFKEVAVAYDLLSDSDKKAKFDRGEIDASGAPRAERTYYRDYAEGGPGTRYSDPNEFFRDMDGTDLFSELFGGRARGRRTAMAGGDIRHAVDIDFLEAVNGASRAVHMADGKRLRVTIPPGSSDGDVLRLKGQGAPGVGGGPAGDLLIELRIKPHPTFTRNCHDISAELPITLAEAVLGCKIEVPTVDGTVNLTIPKGSNTGSRLRVRGKGVPRPGGAGRGDHYVELKVVLPATPDAELTRLVEEWSAKHPYQVRGGR